MSFVTRTIATGGVSGLAGAGLWYSQGNTVLATALFAAGLGLFAALAWHVGLLDVAQLKRAAPATRTVQSLALIALLLVVVVVPTGPVGTASASTTTCDNQSQFMWTFMSGIIVDNRCDPIGIDPLTSSTAADNNSSHLDLYTAATQQMADQEVFFAVYDNYLNDTSVHAWMKAEQALANCWKNGSAESVCEIQVRSAIEDYYVVKQKNLVEQWNVSAETSHSLHNRAYVEGHGNWVHYVYYTQVSGSYSLNYIRPGGLGNSSVTLLDGSTKGVRGVVVEWGTNCGSGCNNDYVYTATPADLHGHRSPDEDVWLNATLATQPTASYPDLKFNSFRKMHSEWGHLQALDNESESEATNFTQAVWGSLETGDINATDLLSRTTLMFELGTSAASDNGTFYDFLAATSSLGVSAPDLNGTGIMDVTYQGSTYEGMLFGNPPNGTWVVGKTYNSTNFTGPVMLATTTGKRYDLNGTFTLQNATDKSGNTVTQVTTKTYNYKTANTTELLNQMNSLLDLYKQYQDRQTTGGGGGGDWFSGLFGNLNVGNAQIVVVIAAAAVLFLAERGG